jgi:hypothetical protein
MISNLRSNFKNVYQLKPEFLVSIALQEPGKPFIFCGTKPIVAQASNLTKQVAWATFSTTVPTVGS